MLENANYCPILHARASEIKALFQLPAASKDRMFPLIVGRPWPNANRLTRTWEKVSEALGSRRFALDLDHSKFGAPTSRPAGAEFNALFDAADGFSNYYSLLREIPFAIPVLRTQGTETRGQLRRELENAEELDRGLVVRVQYDHTQNPAQVIAALKEARTEFVLFVDAGWTPDVLGRTAWADSVLRAAGDDDQSIEVAVCSSSFPQSFTSIQGRGSIQIDERRLFEELVRRHNQIDLRYGDWGSTRPPRESSPMTTVRRIDLPLPRSWVCFRQTEEETYGDIARRVISDHAWPKGLSVWATYTIECTANELPGMIRSPATASAVRINLHLHRQAHFGEQRAVGDADEPFTDD